MEKRKSMRTDFKAEALITCEDVTYKGEVKNLSLSGVFIEINENEAFNLNDKLEITLLIIGQSSDLKIRITGIIVRKETHGIGFEFESMALDSFIHLRNMIAYHTGEYRKVMDEFIKNAFIEMSLDGGHI